MAQPSTRDLGSVIDACRIVEDELTFHATRLDTIGRPTREGEASHHAELASDYKRAARAVGVLRRYPCRPSRANCMTAPPLENWVPRLPANT